MSGEHASQNHISVGILDKDEPNEHLTNRVLVICGDKANHNMACACGATCKKLLECNVTLPHPLSVQTGADHERQRNALDAPQRPRTVS